MDCVITAGGMPEPDDPLYAYSQGRPKAFIDMNGRPMLAHVITALQGSDHVDRVIVVGLAEELPLTFEKPVIYLPDHGSLIGNALAGVAWVQQDTPGAPNVMLSSADIPALTTRIVDDYVDACRPFNCALYYPFITQQVMEARFPRSNRTFVPLKGLRIAGGDLVIIQPDIAESNIPLWEALTNARKHAWKLARVIGFGTLLRFLGRRMSIADIEAKAQRILNRPVKVILSPDAELAMDADKPHQVDLLREDLARHPRP